MWLTNSARFFRGRFRSFLACIDETGYSLAMNTQPEELLTAVLSLSEMERATIAAALLRSLGSHPNPATDAEWEAEIRRRVESIDHNEVILTPWNEVMNSLRERHIG
jgi:putative addiction module component (TIGR02574 family)